MLGKENIKEQVTDNQMDYVANESATVDYEDRLSEDISNGTWHSALDDAASDEVMKKATFFVETFVKEFEEKLSKYFEEAEPDSNIQKISKASASFNSILNNTIPASPLKLFSVKVNESINHCVTGKRHKKRAKNIFTIIIPCYKAEMREILVKAGLEVFHRFEEPFIKVVDINPSFYHRRVKKLAIDAVHRTMNYLLTSEEQDFSVDLITQGVVLGKSKRKGYFTCPGYEIKNEQSSESLLTSELYEWVGIKKKEEDETVNYYQYNSEEHNLEEYSCAEKYGYRLPFEWELRKWEEIKQKYVFSEAPTERYVYILDEEKKKKLSISILKEINENDLMKKKDIEELREEIKNLRIRYEKEDENTFSFNLGYLPKFFIKREVISDELKKKLDSKNQEVEMSRMVLIHGDYGTGKSELARSYGYNNGKDSNVWTNVIWINAKTYGTLLDSFRSLAEELKIPTKNDQEINTDMEVKERQERVIISVVKDVYKHFRGVKSLFIFDNASNYEEIEKFLPSPFSDLFFGREKPYVLITSRNKDWKKEIEKIELDDGFFPEEAIAFIRKILEVKDRSQDCYLVELTQALNYLPLALAQAAAYIKQEKISIIKYLELYDEVMEKSNPDYFEVPGISPELFTTLKVNFDKIRRKKNIGQQSHDIIAYMAYLSPDQIDIEEIFLQKKSEKDKQQILDTLDRFHKFSVIELEESIARIHKGIQKIIRTEKEREGTEEETLRVIMTSFSFTNVNHIISVWNHVSKYSKLVNEFIDFLCDGGTVLHLLAKDGNKEVIELTLEKIDPKKLSKVVNSVDEENLTALDYAVMHGHSDIVKYLIEKGGSIDMQNEGAMYWAANNGDLEIVKCLIKKGADVNLQDKDGMSPMHWAANSGNLEIVEYLVEEGANVNLQDKSGMSSMHWAANSGALEIVKYLVEEGVDVNLQDGAGVSPMHWTAMYGHLDIVKYLVEEGANINLQDEAGVSSMHWAAMRGHLDSVEYFIGKRVNMNLKDIDNNTILDYAVMSDCPDIIECLLEWGANVSPRYEDFLYLYAIANNYQSIIYYLTKAQSIVTPFKRKSETISHMQSQVLMEGKPMTSDLQSHILSDSGQHQYELSKKRRLENVSTISEENASNIQLLQGSQNLPSNISMQFEGLADRTESMIDINSEMPACSFNSVAVEPVNNKNLQVG